jgi:hypothetical protein
VTDDARFQNLTLVIIGTHSDPTSQNDKGLVLGGMVMNRYLSTRFQGIQETMAFIRKTLVKVIILSQPGRILRFVCHLIDELIVNNFHWDSDL